MSLCPCGSKLEYEACCGPIHSGNVVPTTAERLMRARYSAFVKGEIDFIVETTHPKSKDEIDIESIKKWANDSTWIGLQIHSVKGGTAQDNKGEVEFSCQFKINDKDLKHHEHSFFEKSGDRWYFLDGKVYGNTVKRTEDKVGRNDPCPCGSGKKAKKCCHA